MTDDPTPVRCSNCGADNVASAAHCTQCGTRMAAAAPLLPGAHDDAAATATDEAAPPPRQRYQDDFKPLASIGCVFMVLVALGGLAFISVPNFSPHNKGTAREKACYANMRVLLGAIEMYNMDHRDMIGFYNQAVPARKLQTEQYLKSVPQCPEQGASTYYTMRSLKSPNAAPPAEGFGLDTDIPVASGPLQAEADPNSSGSAGTASTIDVDGVIHCPVHGTVE